MRSSALAPPHAFVAWAVILCASACGWDHFDAVDAPTAVSPALDAAAAPDAGDDADALSALTCAQDVPAVRQWTFDSSVQGWTLMTEQGGHGTMSWTNASGDPAPGAIEVDFSPSPAAMANAAFLEYFVPLGDLTGKVPSASVWLDSGAPPLVNLFVQTGSEFAWAAGAGTTLALHQWTCVSFDLATPSFSFPGYDPTDVVILGIEMIAGAAPGPFRVFIDTIGY